MEEVPEYRALFAVDIAGSAGRGDVALRQIREALSTALRESFARSGIDWEACLRQDLGDGTRVVFPAGTPKASLVHPLVHELTVRLRAHNRLAGPPTRVRVRMALHAGDVHIGPDGTVVGRPLEVLARLLDATPARAALAQTPEATTALLVSQHFHEETVCQGQPGIDPASFRHVSVREKEFAASAWLHVPACATPSAAESSGPGELTESGGSGGRAGQDRAADDEIPSNAKMISRASGHGVIYAVQSGTIHISGKT
ncbi:hypothetical protein [Streptomyces violaceusniger]|uniref:Guanylate cyclase domain-containing protein n=1 Tax=Streptomyces violaceusniger (strain Tu 4113) TaxID=653045 RepID=G2PCZ0_STRV4|nr:hypothetical protein [Streptomyces violaceusniger]AEM82616.1 hypothetical protein Strvi_2918 [Streptomyces violaceusniger Tu 4113]